MRKRETPEAWLKLLERQGIHSARMLAEKLDVSVATAVRLLHGEQTSDETVEQAAALLKVTVGDIRRLRGEVTLPPFRLPTKANNLTPRQRAAILAVIRSMLEPHDGPTKTDAASAATVTELIDPEVADLEDAGAAIVAEYTEREHPETDRNGRQERHL